MPKLALISPKGAEFTHDERLANFLKDDNRMKNIRSMWNSPNLGLLVIAAYTPDDWEIDYIDEHVREIDFNIPYDIVSISCMTQQVNRGYDIAGIYREKGILTLMGGIHATMCTEEVAEHVDVVLAGEGEVIWPEFIRDWQKGTYKKIYREENPGTLDITKTKIPRYDLIKDYPYATVTINTSRGCNHDCCFCAASKIYGSVYRRKTNEQIIRELEVIKGLYPNKYVLFGDDNIFVLRQDSKELLREIQKLNIRWALQTDISIAEDEELIKLLADSGCIWTTIGFESIQEANLKFVEEWKADRVKNYPEWIKRIQKYGIGIMGAFVFGLDCDTVDSVDETIKFINDNNFYGIHVTTPTPFPGTRFRKQLEEEDRILNKAWSYYTHWDIVMQPKLMTVDQLRESIYKIYISFSSEENSKKRFTQFIHDMRMKKVRQDL